MSDNVYRAKFTRKITWDEDIMKVSDSVTDVWNDAVSDIRDGLDKQMENAVCNHFDIDMSDFREYMHDKITWERKQELAIPKWIPVTERLPESGEHVLAACEIRSIYGGKKTYVCEAFYAAQHTLPEGNYSADDEFFDYDEEEDEYYLKEGWYEAIHNWDEYFSVVIEDFLTHWMPLPEPPKEEEDA